MITTTGIFGTHPRVSVLVDAVGLGFGIGGSRNDQFPGALLLLD